MNPQFHLPADRVLYPTTTIILSALIASLNPTFSRGAFHSLKFVRSIKCNPPRKSAHTTLSKAASYNKLNIAWLHSRRAEKTTIEPNLCSKTSSVYRTYHYGTRIPPSHETFYIAAVSKSSERVHSISMTPSLAELVAASCLLLAAGTH